MDSPRPAPRLVEVVVESASRSVVGSRRKDLGIVALVLGLVGLFFWHDTIRLGIERDHPDWSGTRISAEVLTHQAGAAVFAVLLVVFWLWLDDKVEQAKPWAPAVFAVLAAIAAVGALQMALDDAFPDVSKVGVLAGAGFGLVSAALLWAPASRSYFARTRTETSSTT